MKGKKEKEGRKTIKKFVVYREQMGIGNGARIAVLPKGNCTMISRCMFLIAFSIEHRSPIPCEATHSQDDGFEFLVDLLEFYVSVAQHTLDRQSKKGSGPASDSLFFSLLLAGATDRRRGQQVMP